MTDPHHLLQLTPNRVAAAVERLRQLIWSRAHTLTVETTAAAPEHVTFEAARRRDLRPLPAGEAWGRLFDQAWRRIDLRGPDGEATDGASYLQWCDQGEATLYVDGAPHYGFDVAHARCRLPAGLTEAWVESLCVQTGIWHPQATGIGPGGSVFDGAFLVRRDDLAWEAFHDLDGLMQVLLGERPTGPTLNPIGHQPPVDRANPSYRRLLRLLDRAVDALDAGGLAALRQCAAEAYAQIREHAPVVRAVLTGHAHIDLVWLWPERVGEAKAVHTFATANRLMDDYPEMRFAHSQPPAYEAVARRAPELASQVQARIAAGQWQATGVLYVESDSLLPCGEALARSFTVGQAAFRRLRGSPARLVWLPDAFGYSGCLPQLMRLSGVEYFFTNKVFWSAINRFPVSSFTWRGQDGSEVLAHVLHEVGYNGVVQPLELKQAAAAHVQSDVHPEYLHPTGYGDGGGGVTEDMCERARRLAAVRGLPAVSWDHPEAFFDRMAERRAMLPTYFGELYLEFHRGTYTTHGAVKAAFRALERGLQVREAVAVATLQAPDLEAVWKRMIFAQFHDYIPGSSIPEVYAEGLPELQRLAGEQMAASTGALSSAAGEPCLFNPLPIARTLVVDDALVTLPPLAGVSLKEARNLAPQPVRASPESLSNGRVTVRLDAAGELAAVEIDGEPLDLQPGASGLVLYPDRAANFEAWDIDRQALALGEKVVSPPDISVEQDACGLRAAIAVRRPVGRASQATVRYELEAASRVLVIKVELDWREPESLLKFHFKTGYRGANIRCGAPFGSVLRPQQPGPTHAEAMWEVPASRWIAGGDDGASRGMFVATEAKYGFSCRDGDWGVSLVRSPRMPGFEAHAAAYPAALSRIESESIYTDQGAHSIALAIGRFDARAGREAHPAALAETLFTPPLAYVGAPVASGLAGIEEAPTLIPCWAKPIGPGDWVLRLHEVAGERGQARLVLAEGWTAQGVDLREEPVGERADGGRFAYRPYEIVSIRLTRRPI